MRRTLAILLSIIGWIAPVSARHVAGECGTTRETAAEAMFVHTRLMKARAAHALGTPVAAASSAQAANSDIGDIAIVHDVNGVVDRQNQFNLDNSTVAFLPQSAVAGNYVYSVATQGYDGAAAASGTPLAALDDDDTRAIGLPFAFPFFGASYTQVFVNSDGNLTFTAGDNASTQRSLGRMTAGPPRIAPLFDDLNPGRTAGGVRVLAEPARVAVSWVAVPEYSDANNGTPQTFQVRLYPDGRIEFAYAGVNPSSAVVGIAPGGLQGQTAIVDFRTDPSGQYMAAVAEVFGNALGIDVVTLAQQFYQTHEDSYDYLVIYNSMDIPALGEGTVAYEQTVRNSGTGFGLPEVDLGTEFGSASRLQAVLNVGPLSQYPADPNALVPARAAQADTPLTILAHEAGHRFLAYASVTDPNQPGALPMLGFQLAHWSFLFDSEASVVEGERIEDKGPTVSPRFLTTDLTQAYSPLDQYLMGFRSAAEVPGVFVVQNPSPNYAPTNHPLPGIAFDGVRRDIQVSDVIAAQGRRTPDDTVAQRRFRFAFILVVAGGADPTAADLAKIDGFRRQFEGFYAQAASNRAAAETTLKRSMRLSLFPAAGVVKETSVAATLTVATAPASDLAIQLAAPNGNARLSASATIPAGATTTTFFVTGVNPGVENVQAIPADPAYETAFARVQVAGSGDLSLTAQLGPNGQVQARLTDANGLPYAGEGLAAIPSTGGVVIPSEAFTDSRGMAAFHWNPGGNPTNQLRLTLDGAPAVSAILTAGSAAPAIDAVVNGASLAAGIAPGGLGAVLGSNLGNAQLMLNGAPLAPIDASSSRIDFYLRPQTATGPATFTVAAGGVQASTTAEITGLAPGIFPNGVRRAGGGPIHAGDTIEIYCTGLGQVQLSGALQTTLAVPTVFVGGTPLTPLYSGLAPGWTGVYQVDVRIPTDAPAGLQSLLLSVNNLHSNQIQILVQ